MSSAAAPPIVATRHQSASLSLLLLLLVAVADSDTPPTALGQVARAYIELYGRCELDQMAAYFATGIVFEDPTTSLFSTAVRVDGRQRVTASFRQAFASMHEPAIEIMHEFFSGQHAVFFYRRSYELRGTPGAAGGQQLRVSVQAVTVLRIRNGRIEHHVDYVDHAGVLRQVEEYASRAASY